MKRFSEQLNKKSQSVKLQAVEKRELRERLVSYMEYHPLPAELKAKVVTPTLLTESFKTFHIPFHALFKSTFVAAAIVLVVVPFAAEKAVPGDTLYAVKVQFNEEVRSTLTFDSYQKVEWETTRLNRRIAEARLLASEGRLTEEVEAEVAEAVKTHTENVQREIEVIRTEDADAAAIASIELDSTLSVQSSSLRGESEEGGTGEEVNLIANALDKSLSESEAKNASTTIPSYNKLTARVEQNTTRIYEMLETITPVTPAEQMADVTRRIEDIERSIQSAIDIVSTDDIEARSMLVDVLQRTQKLIVLMTEIEVAHTIDIETIVPVVLTDSEEDAEIGFLTTELNLKIARIEELYIGVDEEDILAKADFALASISESSDRMSSSTYDYVVFKQTIIEATVMADDMIIILEKYLTPVAVEPVTEETASSTEEIIDEEGILSEQASSSEEIVGELPELEEGTGSTTENEVDEVEVPASSVDNV